MTEFVKGVLSNFDKGDSVCAVFLNFNKAFNKVDRNILLRKLECYGVIGNMHLLISSYLDERKQFVSFGRYEPTCEKIEVGVPQGSLLFLININDLQINTSLSVLNFAYDTLLYKTLPKNTYLNNSKNFNTELSKVSDWLMVNKLKLNLDKTRSMLINQSKNSFWKSIELNEKVSYLIFNCPVYEQCFRYGLLCWGRAKKKFINDINVLINRALNCIRHHKKYDIVRKLKTKKKC